MATVEGVKIERVQLWFSYRSSKAFRVTRIADGQVRYAPTFREAKKFAKQAERIAQEGHA